MKDILNRVISGDLSVVDVLVREALDDANVVKKDDLNNSASLVIAVLGKKSVSRPPEAFFPIVLMTTVEDDGDGEPRFFFETKMNRSTAKTPLGMFNEFRIPNSLALVDKAIRDYHKI